MSIVLPRSVASAASAAVVAAAPAPARASRAQQQEQQQRQRQQHQHVTVEQLSTSVSTRGFLGPYGPQTSHSDSTQRPVASAPIFPVSPASVALGQSFARRMQIADDCCGAIVAREDPYEQEQLRARSYGERFLVLRTPAAASLSGWRQTTDLALRLRAATEYASCNPCGRNFYSASDDSRDCSSCSGDLITLTPVASSADACFASVAATASVIAPLNSANRNLCFRFAATVTVSTSGGITVGTFSVVWGFPPAAGTSFTTTIDGLTATATVASVTSTGSPYTFTVNGYTGGAKTIPIVCTTAQYAFVLFDSAKTAPDYTDSSVRLTNSQSLKIETTSSTSTTFNAMISASGVFTVTSGSLPTSGTYFTGKFYLGDYFTPRTFMVKDVNSTANTFTINSSYFDGERSTAIQFTVITVSNPLMATLATAFCTAYTVNIWVRCDSWSEWINIFAFGDGVVSTETGNQVWFDSCRRALGLTCWGDSSTLNIAQAWYEKDIIVSLSSDSKIESVAAMNATASSEWHMFTVTYDRAFNLGNGSTARRRRTYLDGIMVSEDGVVVDLSTELLREKARRSADTGEARFDNKYFFIGRYVNGDSSLGAVRNYRDLRAWTRMLTPSEVTTLMRETRPGQEAITNGIAPTARARLFVNPAAGSVSLVDGLNLLAMAATGTVNIDIVNKFVTLTNTAYLSATAAISDIRDPIVALASNLRSAYTVNIWCKFSSSDSNNIPNNTEFTIFGYGTAFNDCALGVNARFVDGSLIVRHLWFNKDMDGTVPNGVNVGAETTPKWHMITISWSNAAGALRKTYFDGARIAIEQQTATPNFSNSTPSIYVGRYVNGGTTKPAAAAQINVNNTVGGVRIWSSQLSDAEVNALYFEGPK